MKRAKRSAAPRPTEPARALTEGQLADIRGGATAIEYGLLLVQPTR
jgi:hypothetical protein